MGTMQWTDEQNKTITMRDCNILVSAAAGSGKTTVLVERIFKRIMDKKNPVDVDRFVIVTFTRAAAAHMRDSLRERLEQEVAEKPENTHLQRQLGLIASAHISTVHSFCGYVIQNYFHRIGLDPSYRQGTDSELGLLKNEILEEILEEEYTEQREDFAELAGMNMFHRSDARMLDMIFEVYEKAMSEPFPHAWLDKMRTFLDVREVSEWENSAFCTYLLADCHRMTEGIRASGEYLRSLCRLPAGPYYYEKQMDELDDICGRLLQADTYKGFRQVLSDMTFSKMTSKRDEGVDISLKETVQAGRKRCKVELEEMRNGYFFQSVEEHLTDLRRMGGKLKTLLRLTERFMTAYTEAKRERNIVDFNDLEQLALSILLEWDGEKQEYVRSAAAKELSEHFVEIMIDEYQDSNRVQDTLLGSVSRDGIPGKAPNIFMVGDVKQSIYRFRNACPELFSEKLESYETEEGASYRKIDLHRNFRSREEILEGVNCVFEEIMHRDLGGVEYDEAARLRCGRESETLGKDTEKIDTYVILDKGNAETEGRLIATKIKEMVESPNPLMIPEKEGCRPVCYRDIVILMRSVKNVGQSYFEVLTDAGIPVVMEHTQGFFDTREIQIMTGMLQVIDNPRQDIPLVAVLGSPMFHFSEEELAVVRAANRKEDLHGALCSYDKEDALREKIQGFFQVLGRLREKISYATVAELIQDIYDETGIYESVMMMKEGVQRTANMDSLMELAREFEETTYHGLYQFVRYINRIQEQQEEMGEVNIVGEEENVVRIMTIHKSKGLEFPVCIVAGMGRKLGGINSSFLTIQPDVGIASRIVDNETRTTKDTIYRRFLKRQNDMADLGESMRVLYVAMTRAKEKLILVGCAEKIEAGAMNYLGRSRIGSMLDMVLPAVLTKTGWFTLTTVERESMLEETASEFVQEQVEAAALYNFDTSVVYDKDVHEYLERLEEQIKEAEESLPVKVSVSDLKMKSMEKTEMEDFTILSHNEDDGEAPIPDFMREDSPEHSAYQGAAYGTIWHQVMATIDFAKTGSEEEMKEALDELVRSGKLREEERHIINYKKLSAFFHSCLGQEMREAAAQGKLHREQPFVIGRPANEIFPERAETDIVLVQGIIDGYYESGEGIVLMDYKTDSLKPGEDEKLVCRYGTQMKLYREALEEMLDKPVTKCVLYSFSLQKEIEC